MKKNNSLVLSQEKSASKGCSGFLLIVVLLAAGGFFFRNYINNQIRLQVMKPDKYFEWVYEKNASAVAKGISAGGETVEDNETDIIQQAVQVTAHLEAGEDLQELLQDVPELMQVVPDLVGDDTFGFITELAGETLSKLKSAEVSVFSNFDGHAENANIDLSLNNRHVINVETLTDIDNQLIYYRLPKLSEHWILPEQTTGALINNYVPMIQNNPAQYIIPETIAEMLSRYTQTAVSEISGVEINKDSSVPIGSMTVKYTEMSVDIDSDTAYDMLIALLEEVKADKTINEAANNIRTNASEDFRSDIQNIIDSLTQKKAHQENRFLCTYTTYVNGKGDICGISIESQDQTAFKAVVGRKLRQIAGTVSGSNGSDEISLTLDATADSDGVNGSLTGTLEQNNETHEIKIDISGLRTSSLKKDKVKGSIKMTMDSRLLAEVIFSADENGCTIVMPLNFAEKSFGTLDLTIAYSEATKIKIPDRSEAYTPDEYFSAENFPRIAKKDDYIAFCTELLTGLGMDESKAKSTAEASAKVLYVTSALDIKGKLKDLLPF
ncbi:MAG: DUF6583 family protein [Acutalibacteraceae bacterium]|nr:DUF6583 family protein [Acutalibacteraceae bacterium]